MGVYSNYAFLELVNLIQATINPPGKEKREALLVPDNQWEGIDAWLGKWRGTPWQERKAS